MVKNNDLKRNLVLATVANEMNLLKPLNIHHLIDRICLEETEEEVNMSCLSRFFATLLGSSRSDSVHINPKPRFINAENDDDSRLLMMETIHDEVDNDKT